MATVRTEKSQNAINKAKDSLTKGVLASDKNSSGAQAAKPSSGQSRKRKTYAEAYKNADKSKYKTLADFTVAAKAYNAKKANKSSTTSGETNKPKPVTSNTTSTVQTEKQSVQSSQKKDNMTTGVIAPKPTENKTTEKTKPRTVKQVRQEARSERKSIRKANREERRAPRKARRLANVEARQEKRTNRVEKNQTRKTNNAAKREEKRANRNKIATSSMAKGPNTSVSNNTSGRIKSQFGLATAEAKIKKGNELLANQRLESDLDKTAFFMKETPMKFMQNQQGVQGTPYQDVNQVNANFSPQAQMKAQQMQMMPMNNSPFNITEKQKTLPKAIQEAIIAKEKKQ